ncbi:uncharacterized protein K452DRAFT_358773 [Aplosporella prunicola CBS 121167]|uniref:Uncharacterized protein n=1 Tax=Aplosporella prunicola CBS 121167 TaxID=1176127 RepID=A0A6A6BGK5_9PEZI|nr:uncharacterized protein K452DRAFT_358773 [Aplosporella prunicola CBS 121167]KAF2141661.1 hypothetical protein K452DRAFT_358773 [Aplosporella prunicola CBS 121167]
MPEIPAMEPVDIAPLPAIIPPVVEYRGWRSRMSESNCAMTIWILAESLLEWETYSFLWRHSASVDTNFLRFFFEKAVEGFDYAKGRFNELHLFEDLYYVALAKIIELHSDLRLRFSNGFLHSTTILYTKSTRHETEATTAHDMQQHLEFAWHELTSIDMLAALHQSIQTEHIVRLKAAHNLHVFRAHKRYSTATPTRAALARVRDTLRAHFDPREIRPATPGLADVGRLGAAGLMALVWSRSSFGLQSWVTHARWEEKEEQQLRKQQRLEHLDRISTATTAVLAHSAEHSPSPSSSSGSCSYSPATASTSSPSASSPSGYSTAPTTPDRDWAATAAANDIQASTNTALILTPTPTPTRTAPPPPKRRLRLRHSRTTLHRQRALLKLTGVLAPNSTLKRSATAPSFSAYTSTTSLTLTSPTVPTTPIKPTTPTTPSPIPHKLNNHDNNRNTNTPNLPPCHCAPACTCSYWCAKEPYQPCACRFPAAHIARTRCVSVAGSAYTATSEGVSEPESEPLMAGVGWGWWG